MDPKKAIKKELFFSKLSILTNTQIIDLWKETEKQIMSEELAFIRGILMQILEARDKKAFEKWLNDENVTDRIELYFGGKA